MFANALVFLQGTDLFLLPIPAKAFSRGDLPSLDNLGLRPFWSWSSGRERGKGSRKFSLHRITIKLLKSNFRALNLLRPLPRPSS